MITLKAQIIHPMQIQSVIERKYNSLPSMMGRVAFLLRGSKKCSHITISKEFNWNLRCPYEAKTTELREILQPNIILILRSRSTITSSVNINIEYLYDRNSIVALSRHQHT